MAARRADAMKAYNGDRCRRVAVEAWKYTDLAASLAHETLVPAGSQAAPKKKPKDAGAFARHSTAVRPQVFVGGFFHGAEELPNPGVEVVDLSDNIGASTPGWVRSSWPFGGRAAETNRSARHRFALITRERRGRGALGGQPNAALYLDFLNPFRRSDVVSDNHPRPDRDRERGRKPSSHGESQKRGAMATERSVACQCRDRICPDAGRQARTCAPSGLRRRACCHITSGSVQSWAQRDYRAGL